MQFVIAVGATLALGFGYDPVTAFVLVATIIVIVVVAVYILVNAACIGFFAAAPARVVPPGAGTSSSRCWASPRSCPRC